MSEEKIREFAIKTLAEEVDKALRIGPVAHIKHRGALKGQHGLACLESYLLKEENGEMGGLHAWGAYENIQATSIIFPEAPRGFTIALKKDNKEEYESRGRQSPSIPDEAKTANYTGDYLKIDWVYPAQEIMGLGIPRAYFFAVERAAKKGGFPSIHIDATNGGLSYWARKEFDLKIPEERHAGLIKAYQKFLAEKEDLLERASLLSPYIALYDGSELPQKIDPSKPHTIPRVFMDFLSTFFMLQGGHLHFYKKF